MVVIVIRRHQRLEVGHAGYRRHHGELRHMMAVVRKDSRRGGVHGGSPGDSPGVPGRAGWEPEHAVGMVVLLAFIVCLWG